jgi:hypothetical protein
MTSQLDPVSAPADASATATELFDGARRHQCAGRLTLDTDDVPAIRSEGRKPARAARLRI